MLAFSVNLAESDMRVFIRTFGCTTNTADSQAMAGCLAEAGFPIVDEEAKADVVICNSCAVKGPTENRVIDSLRRAQKGKKIVVTGCLPMVNFERLASEVHFDGMVGPAVGEKIVDIVKRVWKGETLTMLDGALASKPNLSLPRIHANPVVSVVPVSYGCLGSCTYCCVVQARGRLRSCSVAEVGNRVEMDIAAGAREIWLTSQDMGCYGKDLGVNLAELIETVCHVEGNFWVRVGMMTPHLIIPYLSKLVSAFRCKKVFKFVHLPVQSGDDGVLLRMHRFYTTKEFQEIVATFRRAIPEITVSTDVICGFPGESEESFQNTLRLIESVQPDVVNISKFFARPKTAAWKMRSEAVDKVEVKKRSIEAAKAARQISLIRNQRWLGWMGEILVDEKGKIDGTWVGRNFAYKPVVVRNPTDLLGKTVHVKIVKAFETYLSGLMV